MLCKKNNKYKDSLNVVINKHVKVNIYIYIFVSKSKKLKTMLNITQTKFFLRLLIKLFNLIISKYTKYGSLIILIMFFLIAVFKYL